MHFLWVWSFDASQSQAFQDAHAIRAQSQTACCELTSCTDTQGQALAVFCFVSSDWQCLPLFHKEEKLPISECDSKALHSLVMHCMTLDDIGWHWIWMSSLLRLPCWLSIFWLFGDKRFIFHVRRLNFCSENLYSLYRLGLKSCRDFPKVKVKGC